MLQSRCQKSQRQMAEVSQCRCQSSRRYVLMVSGSGCCTHGLLDHMLGSMCQTREVCVTENSRWTRTYGLEQSTCTITISVYDNALHEKSDMC